MRNILPSLLFIAVVSTTNGLAQTSVHPSIPKLEVEPVVHQIRDRHTWYMNPANQEGSFEQRQAKINATVRKLFKDLKTSRAAAYAAHRVRYTEIVSCKANRSAKSCNGRHDFGADYEVIDVQATGEVTDIQKGPQVGIALSAFHWLIKAGAGKQTAGTVLGNAKLKGQAAARRLEEDLEAVRGRLAAEKLPDDRVPDPVVDS